jgi:hypothetical protein
VLSQVRGTKPFARYAGLSNDTDDGGTAEKNRDGAVPISLALLSRNVRKRFRPGETVFLCAGANLDARKRNFDFVARTEEVSFFFIFRQYRLQFLWLR